MQTTIQAQFDNGSFNASNSVESIPTPPVADSIAANGQDFEGNEDGTEFLTRGPLHEAFAQPYTQDPQPGPVINAEPPAPIDELVPEFKPEGNNIVWISGYWDFDPEADDFIWVSGLWRKLPPGQRWIPGYWQSTTEPVGFRRVPGLWASEQIAELEYLPLPPASLENGPSSPAPSEDHFYIPGNWQYVQSDYRWSPGFWSRGQSDWVWVPNQYTWTPSGCIHQQGYWDRPFTSRGVLFTPVRYNQPIYQNASYQYRPQYTIQTGLGLLVNLFVGVTSRKYYYGDYYGPNFGNRYRPWGSGSLGAPGGFGRPGLGGVGIGLGGGGRNNLAYDPFFEYYRYRGNRSGFNGVGNVLSFITNQRTRLNDNADLRPRLTMGQQRNFLSQRNNIDIDLRNTLIYTQSLGELAQSERTSGDRNRINRGGINQTNLNALESARADADASGFDFEPVSESVATQIRERLQPLSELSQSRSDIESNVPASVEPTGNTRPRGLPGNLDARDTGPDSVARGDRSQRDPAQRYRAAKLPLPEIPGVTRNDVDSGATTGSTVPSGDARSSRGNRLDLPGMTREGNGQANRLEPDASRGNAFRPERSQQQDPSRPGTMPQDRTEADRERQASPAGQSMLPGQNRQPGQDRQPGERPSADGSLSNPGTSPVPNGSMRPESSQRPGNSPRGNDPQRGQGLRPGNSPQGLGLPGAMNLPGSQPNAALPGMGQQNDRQQNDRQQNDRQQNDRQPNLGQQNAGQRNPGALNVPRPNTAPGLGQSGGNTPDLGNQSRRPLGTPTPGNLPNFGSPGRSSGPGMDQQARPGGQRPGGGPPSGNAGQGRGSSSRGNQSARGAAD